MELHYLDSGGARFLEIQLFLVIEGAILPELFKGKAQQLIQLWPVLNTRMNFWRTSTFSLAKTDVDGLWHSTSLSSRLKDIVPALGSEVKKWTIDSLEIQRLFPKLDGFYDTLFPRNFKIRAAFLRDASVLRFTFQHPFCDAGGVHTVVKAYCDLLQGHDLPPLDFDTSLDLHTNDEDGKTSTHMKPELVAMRHAEYFNHGWSAVIAGAWKHRVYGRHGPTRTYKTFLVPMVILDRLATAAEEAGTRITKHDLLLAMIHQASMTGPHIPATPLSPPQFSFVINFSRFLPREPVLHNPWMFVQLPDFSSAEESQTTRIIHIAKLVRSTIIDARRPQVVKQIMEQQKDVRAKPLVPVHYAAHEPQLSISSWTHLPLFNMEFPSDSSLRTLKPKYAQCSVNLCPFLSIGGLTIDDTILTWRSHEGFWISGNIDERIWGRLEHLRASFYK